MRISDWSSDVCSSDLLARDALQPRQIAGAAVDRRPFFDLRQHRRVGGALDRVVFGCGKAGHRPAIAGGEGLLHPHSPFCRRDRSEEHTSELQSLMRISYAVFCLKKKTSTTKRS